MCPQIIDHEFEGKVIIICSPCRGTLRQYGRPAASRVQRYGGPTPAKKAALEEAVERRDLEVAELRSKFLRATEAEVEVEEEAAAAEEEDRADFEAKVLDDDERAEAAKLASRQGLAARLLGAGRSGTSAVGLRVARRGRARSVLGRLAQQDYLVDELVKDVEKQWLVHHLGSTDDGGADFSRRHDAWRCPGCDDPDHSELKGQRFFVQGYTELVCKQCALDAASAPAPKRPSDRTCALRLSSLDDDAALIEAATRGSNGDQPDGPLARDAGRVILGAGLAKAMNDVRAKVIKALKLPKANREATTETFALARPVGIGVTDHAVIEASSKNREAPDAVAAHVFLKGVAAACKSGAFTADDVAPLMDVIEDTVPMNAAVRDFLGENYKEVIAAWARVACSRRNKRVAHRVFADAALYVWWHAEQRAAIAAALREGATGFEAVSLHQVCCGFCEASFSALGAVTNKGAIPLGLLPKKVGMYHTHSLIAVQYDGVQEECCVECAAWRVIPAGASFQEGTFACHMLPGLSCAASAELYEEDDADDVDGPASKRSRAA